MNKLLTLLFALLLSVGTAEVYSQDYGSYLQNAQEHFDAGNYESAQKALVVYCKLTGKAETEFEQKIGSCIEYIRLAEQAEKEQKYTVAIIWYTAIIRVNPKDQNALNEIDRLKRLNSTSMVSTPAGYIEIPELNLAVQTKDAVLSEITLEESKELAIKSRIGNYSDWRLPTESEMRMLGSYQDVIRNAMLKQYGDQYRYRDGYQFHGHYWTSTYAGQDDVGKYIYYYNYTPFVNSSKGIAENYRSFYKVVEKKTKKDTGGSMCHCRLVRTLH